MGTVFKTVHRVEDILLVVLLSTMIVLASLQIVLRNLFDYGLVWADPLLRVMVLWLGLIGATVASRGNKHIKIDLLSRYFHSTSNLLIQAVVNIFTAVVCLTIAWHGAHWIKFEYTDQMVGFVGIPAWLLEVIIPLSFALIGIRYCLMSLSIGRYFYRRSKIRRGLRK
jgi:TRAP-type C4-dicarboxylate transport system permease small subunit